MHIAIWRGTRGGIVSASFVGSPLITLSHSTCLLIALQPAIGHFTQVQASYQPTIKHVQQSLSMGEHQWLQPQSRQPAHPPLSGLQSRLSNRLPFALLGKPAGLTPLTVPSHLSPTSARWGHCPVSIGSFLPHPQQCPRFRWCQCQFKASLQLPLWHTCSAE